MNSLWLLITPLAVVVTGVVAGRLYQQAGERKDRQQFLAPGKLVQAGDVQLHLLSQGAGSPPVVFEAGIAASSVSWGPVQARVARHTRAISYDRAGFAWSDACPQLREDHAGSSVEELRLALPSMGIREPVVLVGHSFGGLLARLFAASYPQEVAGLVLVDPALTGEWAHPSAQRTQMLARGIALSKRGAVLCRFGVVRFALNALSRGARFLPRLIASASSQSGGRSTLERLIGEVRKLPEEHWPAVQSHWSRAEAFESMAVHLAALPATAFKVASQTTLGDLPMVVISGAHLTPGQLDEHRAVAKLSSRGEHVVAVSGEHWVHLDDPETVVAAVLKVVDQARQRRRPFAPMSER